MISYFDWLVDLTYDGYHEAKDYSLLYEKLFDTPFYAVIHRDENRAEDGLELRNQYIYELGLPFHPDTLMAPIECSCLEMLTALAIRIEEDIMYDPDEGDRIGKWFWIMIDNLGLTDYPDEVFDSEEADYILSKWLEREYKRDGRGGIFYTNNPSVNMRKTEIWYQMNYYFEEF